MPCPSRFVFSLVYFSSPDHELHRRTAFCYLSAGSSSRYIDQGPGRCLPWDMGTIPALPQCAGLTPEDYPHYS